MDDNLYEEWTDALCILEAKAKKGKCTREEHRLILFYRYSLHLIPSHVYWLGEV